MGKGLIGHWQLLNALMIAHGMNGSFSEYLTVKEVDQALVRTGYYFPIRVIRKNLVYFEKAFLVQRLDGGWRLSVEGVQGWARGAYSRASAPDGGKTLDWQDRGE